MKKFVVILLIFIALICVKNPLTIFADSTEQQLENNTNEIIGDLNLGEFDTIIEDIDNNELFRNESFVDKIKKLVNGEYELSFTSIVSVISSQLIKSIKGILPSLSIICVIAILSNLLNQSKSSNSSKSIGEIIHFACFTIIVLVVFNMVFGLVDSTTNVLNSIKNQMELIFPILLTLMATIGSTVSVGIYQPLVAVLSGGLMGIFQNIILPLFIFSLAFNVIGNLSNNIKLNKFCDFFNSIFKTLIGFVFTLFMAFLTIQGISAGSYDGISFKTAKFAIKSYVPFLGGYLSDGLNLIITSSVLVKNAVGVGGLLILLSTVISPILSILIIKLGLSFIASILEPIADKKSADFISGISKSLNMLLATVLAISFAYLLTVGLLLCSSNLLF